MKHMISRSTLASDSPDNTPANLLLCSQNPDAIKPGSLMPAMKLTDADLDDVTAYLETLR
jgi:cytochrome c oxidase subunit II